MHPILLARIDAYLDKSGMSETYLGKAAAGNSEVVRRLRNGGRVWPETEAKILSFIMMREKIARTKLRMSSKADIQNQPRGNTPASSPQ